MIAQCKSVKCCGYGNKAKAAVVKDVPEKTMDCPDCKSVLFWKKESTKRSNSGHQASFKRTREKLLFGYSAGL